MMARELGDKLQVNKNEFCFLIVSFCVIFNKCKRHASIYSLQKKKSGINFRRHHLPKHDCRSKAQVVTLRFSNQQYRMGVVQIFDLIITFFFVAHQQSCYLRLAVQ